MGRALGGAPHLHRGGHALLPALSRAHGRECAQVHDPGRRQPVIDLFLPARRARIRPQRARRDHLGDVRGPERRLDRHPQLRVRPAERARRVGVPRLGEDALAPLPRRDVRDHAARRGLPFHPAGHAHRARRQYRAHPRHQVPYPPALDGRRRRGRGLLPVGVAAAVAVGIRGLQEDLQRCHLAAAGGRAPGAPRRHAALAAQLPQLHRRHAGTAVRRQQPRVAAAGR